MRLLPEVDASKLGCLEEFDQNQQGVRPWAELFQWRQFLSL
jgi:hypothetical protein